MLKMKYFINKYMDYDCIYLNSTEYGFLQLYVVHNVVDTPIEGAEVTVYKVSYSGLYNEKAEGRRVGQYKTDKQGYTPKIELPVLNELLPGNDYYYITVRADGYNNAFIMNVQVYSNILTSYKVSLIHYGYSDVEFNFMIQPTRTEMHNPNHFHQRNHDSRRP
jgi:hypothetical protein